MCLGGGISLRQGAFRLTACCYGEQPCIKYSHLGRRTVRKAETESWIHLSSAGFAQQPCHLSHEGKLFFDFVFRTNVSSDTFCYSRNGSTISPQISLRKVPVIFLPSKSKRSRLPASSMAVDGEDPADPSVCSSSQSMSLRHNLKHHHLCRLTVLLQQRRWPVRLDGGGNAQIGRRHQC